MKDKGESWRSQYFRDTTLTENVIPFLENEKNVIDVDEVIFVHDKKPYIRATGHSSCFIIMAFIFEVTITDPEILTISMRQNILGQLSKMKLKKNVIRKWTRSIS